MSELNKQMNYQMKFIQNSSGQVILDRRFNTGAMLQPYYPSDVDWTQRIRWNPDDPNSLRLSLPGGTSIASLVTRRSENVLENQNRIETSELIRMATSYIKTID